MGARLAVGGVVLALLFSAEATAFSLPPTLGPGGCYDPTQSNADFEAYGPTDLNAQAGNGRVTVNENAAGTITVLTYPNPNLHNQVKNCTGSRDTRSPAPTRVR